MSIQAMTLRARHFVHHFRWSTDTASQRALLVSGVLALVIAHASLDITSTYPKVSLGLASALVTLLLIQNELRALLVVLWFSTVYLTVQATVLAWSPMSFLLKDGMVALVFGYWLFHFLLRQEKLRRTPLSEPLGALVFWLTVQCFNPNTYGVMSILVDLRFWLIPLAIFILTVQLIETRQDVDRAIRFILGYAIIETFYGVAQQFMPYEWLIAAGADPGNYFYFVGSTVRSFSTMGTVGFGLFAAMMLPLLLFQASQQTSHLWRWLYYGLGVVFLAGILFTYVRTSWVAVGVALIAYSVISRRWAFVALMVIVLVVALSGASGFMAFKLYGIFNPADDPSVQARLTILDLVSEGVVFRVFGYGLGTFAHNRFGVGFTDKTGYGVATENWYLMTSLQLGWIGVLILVWMFFKIYREVWVGYHGGLKTHRYRELALAIGASLLCVEVSRLGGPAGYFPPDSWHYWFFVGLLMRLPDIDRELAEHEAGNPVPTRTEIVHGRATRSG